jgi:hypothetical protein
MSQLPDCYSAAGQATLQQADHGAVDRHGSRARSARSETETACEHRVGSEAGSDPRWFTQTFGQRGDVALERGLVTADDGAEERGGSTVRASGDRRSALVVSVESSRAARDEKSGREAYQNDGL